MVASIGGREGGAFQLIWLVRVTIVSSALKATCLIYIVEMKLIHMKVDFVLDKLGTDMEKVETLPPADFQLKISAYLEN